LLKQIFKLVFFFFIYIHIKADYLCGKDNSPEVMQNVLMSWLHWIQQQALMQLTMFPRQPALKKL
jgi:hypothetical protein